MSGTHDAQEDDLNQLIETFWEHEKMGASQRENIAWLEEWRDWWLGKD